MFDRYESLSREIVVGGGGVGVVVVVVVDLLQKKQVLQLQSRCGYCATQSLHGADTCTS